MESVQKCLKELEEQASDEGDADLQRKQFTGIVFVVFKKPSDCLKVLVHQNDGIFIRIFKILFSCLISNENSFIWERAPEPTDIFWENLNVSVFKRVFKNVFSYFVTFLLICLCFLFISLIKLSQDTYMKEIKRKQEEGDLELTE
mmetsp:Transcript_17892/g.30408  ORF Transcript_17892/g.30408 Transcript_17892/m.30408 type:complete len:145 (+) Transcript_17892:1292-1726(+)